VPEIGVPSLDLISLVIESSSHGTWELTFFNSLYNRYNIFR